MKFFNKWIYKYTENKIKELDKHPELNKQSNITNDQVKQRLVIIIIFVLICIMLLIIKFHIYLGFPVLAPV